MANQNPHVKGWLRVIIAMVAYFFVVLIFNLVARQLVGVDRGMRFQGRTDFQNLIIVFFEFLGTISVLLLLLKTVDKETFISIGLRLKSRTKDIVIGVVLGFIIMGLAFLSFYFFGEIRFENINFNFQNLIFIFLLFVMVSVKEEILLRGYVLRNFIYSFNKYIALILSAFLFSIMHGLNPSFDLQAFINLFLAGIMLGLPYCFNKNLWFPIAFHFSWNFFQSLFGFRVSGLDAYSLIEFSIPDKNIINGGDFGFEGSILSIIVQVIIIITMLVYYQKKDKQKLVSND